MAIGITGKNARPIAAVNSSRDQRNVPRRHSATPKIANGTNDRTAPGPASRTICETGHGIAEHCGIDPRELCFVEREEDLLAHVRTISGYPDE